MRITNAGSRSFIVKASSVIRGGEKVAKTEDISINPGDTVEVTEECGEHLELYSDIRVVERGAKKIGGKKNAVEPAVAK